MKKLHSLMACALIACASLVLFSSCEGKNNDNGIDSDNSSGYAPKSLVGQTFNGDMYFETESTFSFTEDGNYANSNDNVARITYTPQSYTYRKTGDDTAVLTFIYIYEFKGHSISKYDEKVEKKYTYHLHFTSDIAGWYTSDETEYADFILD